MTGTPVRTVFLGSGAFAVPALRALAADDRVALVGVVTAPPRPSGRSGLPTPTPVAEAAAELRLRPLLTPDLLRDPVAIAAVLALHPDLAVLADYGQIVPPQLLELRYGALNLHPSLLPRHRGATPVPAAILAGDATTGVTLMRMDAGLDTGPIVAQERVPLEGRETAPELETRLADIAAVLLTGRLAGWLAGALEAVPQSPVGATLTRPLRRSDGRLDVTRPATELERQVRAYLPWPGSFVETPLGRLVVWAATAEPTPDGTVPQRGVFDALGLGVGDGERLRLLEVQPAGGRRMPWDAYLRGRSSIVGTRVDESTD